MTDSEFDEAFRRAAAQTPAERELWEGYEIMSSLRRRGYTYVIAEDVMMAVDGHRVKVTDITKLVRRAASPTAEPAAR